ncbi:hypothetical protein CK203_110038 [Vitis vinifera]|uniref:Uncharacterized protein n=1 Tax=Vitis vinifera TaxID=29760 RepID=A0A438DCF8_VITVI|nr:hypothetical protein CK203_110038 [Vitis vinifera]
MKDNETIIEMITRFTYFVNGLGSLGKDLQGIRKGDEDLEDTSIKVAYQGHRNSRSQRLDQATFVGAHRVIDII